ncbi:hypothetical protein BUZ15_00055 [Staphylococcus gallinarum]|uniref:hypothetical protein n=1 Tax=Staphylococcus gallinarum TaxID=1293 RepID=UPI000D1E4329|nr:hypothetical protein [Staphylococcus gallinarum]MCD8822112.1 hypothetical protein [Staphylococcus gallinarum]PTL11167.1 hypothetical protein BUZ09_03405 [Staphylococcus gallinarum]PTL11446.1 hypothetical protein BUZ15_00055 [Staphylococcus gallinarum]RIL29276.1 hypothetical protein BUY98_13175 [Staphylococcus gallinarum]RIO78015.1 hypothetical protein BUZ12_02405 [Staphylococcus gallinarum]
MVNLENEHESYRSFFSDNEYKQRIKMEDSRNRIGLKLPENRVGASKKVINIFDSLLSIFPKREFYFYMQIMPQNYNPSYFIHTKDFTAVMQIRLAGGSAIPYLSNLSKKYETLIEIEGIHSFKKGVGKDLVNSLKEVSNHTKAPIYLFDNNLKDENYYQNLGFVNSHSKGYGEEPLLVYLP